MVKALYVIYIMYIYLYMSKRGKHPEKEKRKTTSLNFISIHYSPTTLRPSIGILKEKQELLAKQSEKEQNCNERKNKTGERMKSRPTTSQQIGKAKGISSSSWGR